MNAFGIVAGIVTLLIIGLGFPLVIYSERFFGYVCWPYLMGLGILLVALSVMVSSQWGSMAIGAVGATMIWGSTELKEQAVRVEIGWFPLREDKIKLPFTETIQKWKAPHL